MNQYIAIIQHDKGKFKMRVNATSAAEAIKAIMNAEGCPERAILSLKHLVFNGKKVKY